MVSEPVIDFFANDMSEGYRVVVATNQFEKSDQIIGGRPNIDVIDFEANDTNLLKNIISDADIVISLLPASLHVPVAKACIEKKVHLVTTSYISPEMQQLDSEAQNAQVTILVN
jgi:alpha-aminoadipic semialdehyde synthase